jgi:hypothetical protein
MCNSLVWIYLFGYLADEIMDFATRHQQSLKICYT